MSGTFYGADVAELRQLAQRFTAAADDLDRAARVLTQQVMTTTQWRGADAEGFRGQWSSGHRVNVVAVAGSLRSAAGALTRNADEQARASAAGGGTGGQGGARGGAPSWFQDHVTEDGPFGLPTALISALQGVKLPNGMPLWDTISLVAKALDLPVVDVISDLQTAGVALDGLVTGQLSPLDAADAVGMLLQKVPVPTVALAGVAVDVWTDVIRHYQEADFSPEGIDLVARYIRDDPLGALAGAAEGIASGLPEIGGHILDGFKAVFRF